ncbi:DUF6036 family nucleotidyltransferase [Arthrobacter sp. 2MCAF14]|uniref:DUF6036 family nucleotidyltransferase n=1 Tax=Arthrobacter sp. 2MCAF14 TaxID=3232982 RepID=UPI003F900D09
MLGLRRARGPAADGRRRALVHELRRSRPPHIPAGRQYCFDAPGGAALILQGIGNRPTADINAGYADPTTVNTVVTDMAADYDLAPGWLNSNAAAFVPDTASWIELEHPDELTIQAADTETLLAMKIAAERDGDTLDIARILRRLNITNADDAVDLAYDKYGDRSIPLAAGRDNYLLVVDDPLDAATTLEPNPANGFPDRPSRNTSTGAFRSRERERARWACCSLGEENLSHLVICGTLLK